jgi:hypothetical protein
MHVTCYISFFFLLCTIALAAPVRYAYNVGVLNFTPSCDLQAGEYANDLNLVGFWRRASLIF